MDVSIAEARDQFAELIQAVENGEEVIITRDGKPVAQLSTPGPTALNEVQFDGMRDRIELLPGWDDPIDPDRFLAGDV